MTRNEIIVGLDDSPSGRAALRWAARQAVLAGSLLRAIHVLDWPYGSATDPEGNTSQPSHAEIDESYRRSITAVFEQADPDPDWQLEFARGDAGPVLVREAKGAQLLVVGTREHVGLGRLLVGSISHYCLTHATCPVVAIPAETS
ncbi:MAG TPA: universal stress protein [Propionibacteriaceae bacterium]|nr:universal stress protein [Propionibacteriaceae bacterium]